MSGDGLRQSSVSLFGPVMEALVLAVPEVEARTGRPVTLVGGLEVICRLGAAYRATSDLDTANRRSPEQRPQLEILIASGATPQGPSGVRIPTPRGEVQVDVLEVVDHELSELPDDPTDRLHVMAHAWAVDSATPMLISVAGSEGSARPATLRVRVASPGPLIAMKLQAIMNRPSSKEGTDLLDILRLTLDPAAGPTVREQLQNASPQISHDAALHARRWFVDQRLRTLRQINTAAVGEQVDLDTIDLVGDLLLGALEG
ncbi:MAG: prevent-host-death protein [Actinomycetota bacterium]